MVPPLLKRHISIQTGGLPGTGDAFEEEWILLEGLEFNVFSQDISAHTLAPSSISTSISTSSYSYVYMST
jgi:hypothetical protein